MREKRKKGYMGKKKTEIKCRNGPIYETRKEGYLLIDPFEVRGVEQTDTRDGGESGGGTLLSSQCCGNL